MARIKWGETGERLFELGIDRGVLYPNGGRGVPWNGLKSINETTDGNEPKSFYIDGYKYLLLSGTEEYKATITALYSPREFDVCEGIAPVKNGLYAALQPRVPFNLCYRTLVGNDVDGVDYGYKLHLVYNAVVAPTSRNNVTINNGIAPTDISWNIVTRAPQQPGIRPTSHFVIDSQHVPDGLITRIENTLYGDSTNNATMPSVSELVEMFDTYVLSSYGFGPYGEVFYGL